MRMGTSQTSPGKLNHRGLDLEKTSRLRSRQEFFLDIPFDRTHWGFRIPGEIVLTQSESGTYWNSVPHADQIATCTCPSENSSCSITSPEHGTSGIIELWRKRGLVSQIAPSLNIALDTCRILIHSDDSTHGAGGSFGCGGSDAPWHSHL